MGPISFKWVLKQQWIPLVVGLAIGLFYIVWDLESWQAKALGWPTFVGLPGAVGILFYLIFVTTVGRGSNENHT